MFLNLKFLPFLFAVVAPETILQVWGLPFVRCWNCLTRHRGSCLICFWSFDRLFCWDSLTQTAGSLRLKLHQTTLRSFAVFWHCVFLPSGRDLSSLLSVTAKTERKMLWGYCNKKGKHRRSREWAWKTGVCNRETMVFSPWCQIWTILGLISGFRHVIERSLGTWHRTRVKPSSMLKFLGVHFAAIVSSDALQTSQGAVESARVSLPDVIIANAVSVFPAQRNTSCQRIAAPILCSCFEDHFYAVCRHLLSEEMTPNLLWQ